MSFESTSRKDDLISIFYLLATFLNDNKFPCVPNGFDPFKHNSDLSSKVTKFSTLKEIKGKFDLVTMSQNLGGLNKQLK